MSSIPTNTLLRALQALTRQLSDQAQQQLAKLSPTQLQWKPAPDKWSVAECLEHLNIYGRYYLPEMEQQIQKGLGKNYGPRPGFSSSFLGRMSINSVRLNNQGQSGTKMKTFANYDPAKKSGTQDKARALDEFIRQQQRLLQLLDKAQQTDLVKVKIPISQFKLLKLSLGDCLQFVVYHNERHFVQAGRVTQHPQFPKS